MKKLRIFTIALLLTLPAVTFAQTKSSSSYQKKTTRTRVTKDTSDVSAILKDTVNQENGPILNDNGSVSTTGTIDGRSSTGRKDADTTTSYSVKKTKKTVRTDQKKP